MKKKRLEILENGLINSIVCYLGSRSSRLTIGIYRTDHNSSILLFKEFKISMKEFGTVVHIRGWIDGQIIDAYVTTLIAKWNNISYLPTDIGCTVIGNFWNKRKNPKLKVCNISSALCNTLLMPYAFEGTLAITND